MAAQTGEAIFQTPNGRICKEVYFDDTAGNAVRWDGGSGAGAASPTEWITPYPCKLVDLILAAATGQTQTQLNRNDAGTGQIVLNAIHLASVTFRPVLGTSYNKGDKVTMIQLA